MTNLEVENEVVERQLGYIVSKNGFSYITRDEFEGIIKADCFGI